MSVERIKEQVLIRFDEMVQTSDFTPLFQERPQIENISIVYTANFSGMGHGRATDVMAIPNQAALLTACRGLIHDTFLSIEVPQTPNYFFSTLTVVRVPYNNCLFASMAILGNTDLEELLKPQTSTERRDKLQSMKVSRPATELDKMIARATGTVPDEAASPPPTPEKDVKDMSADEIADLEKELEADLAKFEKRDEEDDSRTL